MQKRLIPACILATYGALLVKVLVFKDLPTIRIGHMMFNFGGAETGYPPNFVPFATILPYLLGHKGWIIAGLNLFGNIALLVPVGILIPFVFRRMTWKTALIASVAAGLILETLQVLFQVGIFDVDDVILNGLGVIVGYGIFRALAGWMQHSP